jgi:hypothetical protein
VGKNPEGQNGNFLFAIEEKDDVGLRGMNFVTTIKRQGSGSKTKGFIQENRRKESEMGHLDSEERKRALNIDSS